MDSISVPDFTFKCRDGDVKCNLFPLYHTSSVIKDIVDEMRSAEMPIHYSVSEMNQFISYILRDIMDVCAGKTERKYASIPWQLHKIFQMMGTWHADELELFDFSDFHPFKMTSRQQVLTKQIQDGFAESPKRAELCNAAVPILTEALFSDAGLCDSPDVEKHIRDDLLYVLLVNIIGPYKNSHHWDTICLNKSMLGCALKIMLERLMTDNSYSNRRDIMEKVAILQRQRRDLAKFLLENFYSKLAYLHLIEYEHRDHANAYGVKRRKSVGPPPAISAGNSFVNMRDDFLQKRLHYESFATTMLYKPATNSLFIRTRDVGFVCLLHVDDELKAFCKENIEYFSKMVVENEDEFEKALIISAGQ